MAVKTLADGKTKFTLLVTAPVNPEYPTATELNAGIDASFKVTAADFSWTPADSETVSEGALGEESAAEVLARSNFTVGFVVWRYYLTGGGVDPAADALFAAVKEKGTELYGYTRKNDKSADEPWAAADEIILGALIVTDHPQDPGAGGWVKFRVPAKAQRGWPWTTVGPVTP